MTDPLQAAEAALAKIGTGWSASRAEREYLDFKETPETALPAHVLERRNLNEERKRFFALIAETAICLANSNGGVIVLGVRDRASTREEALQGADAIEYSADALRIAVHQRTRPAMSVDVSEVDIDGIRIVFIRIARGTVVYATSDGVYKRRVGDQCQPIGGDEMRQLQAARGQYDWSAEPSGLGIDAISRTALAAAGDYLRRAGRAELADSAERDPAQFLSDCELLVDGDVRRAGIVLYGRGEAVQALVADWGVIFTTADSPGAEGSVLIGREDAAQLSILPLIREILTRMEVLASSETIRVQGREIHLIDYPVEDVVRELVANAFAHRDWERPGTIEIRHSPDELVITSPGALLPTLHPDRLLRETAQRNRLLAREIARLKIAEGAGLGFDRVWRALASLGKQPPQIIAEPNFTVVVEGGRGDQAFARFVNRMPDAKLANDLDILLALSALRNQKTTDAPKLADTLQRDPQAAQRVLGRLNDAGLVEPTKRTARYEFPSYRLTATSRSGLRGALSYRVDSIDSDDAKLVRHLKRHRRISNEDVRDYLECDVPTARNRLTRMRKKGWIDFAPDSPRRGPNVAYVALEAVDAVE